MSDSRAAAAEPTSVSSYAPRDEPAPDRLPAVRGSAGDLVGGQGYPPSRDYRPMEYPTTDYGYGLPGHGLPGLPALPGRGLPPRAG